MTIFAFLLFLLTVMREEAIFFARNEFDEVFIHMVLYMHFL